MSGMSIGIVGGAAAAVCLLDALAQAAVTAGRVTVFDPSAHLWRGRAYQVDSEVLKLNTTPEEMSVRANDPHHFERWLNTRERIALVGGSVDVYSGARFAPRTVYGEYLEQSAYTALRELRGNGWVNLVGTGVTAARRDADRVELSTADGGVGRFDYVVLCVAASTEASPDWPRSGSSRTPIRPCASFATSTNARTSPSSAAASPRST